MSGSNGAIIGAPNLALIDAVTQFVGGTQAVWNTITIPIPAGLVVYAVDTTAIKMGDGVTLYANLPVLFQLNAISSLTAQLASLTSAEAGFITAAAVNTAIGSAITAALSGYTTTAAITASLAGYAALNGATFTASPLVPTAPVNDASQNAASTAYVDRAIAAVALEAAAGITPTQLQADITAALSDYVLTTALTAYAPLSSPGFVGTPSINGAGGTTRQMSANTATVARWAWGANQTAETGSNAGSDYVIGRFSDTGTYLDTPFTINRASGVVTLTASPVIPTPVSTDNTTNAASTAYVTAAVAAEMARANGVEAQRVQQGTGIGQAANIVKIGYAAGGLVKVTIDTTDMGGIAFQSWVTSYVQTALFSTIRNVTTTRAIGTTYVNTTGRPMFVSIDLGATNAAASFGLAVNGIPTTQAQGTDVSVCAIVPAGGNYQLQNTAWLGFINCWSETY